MCIGIFDRICDQVGKNLIDAVKIQYSPVVRQRDLVVVNGNLKSGSPGIAYVAGDQKICGIGYGSKGKIKGELMSLHL